MHFPSLITIGRVLDHQFKMKKKGLVHRFVLGNSFEKDNDTDNPNNSKKTNIETPHNNSSTNSSTPLPGTRRILQYLLEEHESQGEFYKGFLDYFLSDALKHGEIHRILDLPIFSPDFSFLNNAIWTSLVSLRDQEESKEINKKNVKGKNRSYANSNGFAKSENKTLYMNLNQSLMLHAVRTGRFSEAEEMGLGETENENLDSTLETFSSLSSRRMAVIALCCSSIGLKRKLANSDDDNVAVQRREQIHSYIRNRWK